MSLTYQQQEFINCARSPLYFLDNYGHVFNAAKRMFTAMECFDYQRDCLKAFHKYQNNIVLKSRQTGISVVTAGYVAWRLMFSIDEKILIVANDGAGAIRFLESVKVFINNTPDWLKPMEVKNNEKYISFTNNCWAKAVAASPEAGRGESLTMLILDEVAFIDNADSIWMGAGMAVSQTKGKCIMISTPNGTGNLYHRTWVASIKNENNFNRLEVHWTENPISAKGLEVRVDDITGKEYRWSPWYQEQIERLEHNTVKIAQELDLSFEGSKYLAIEHAIIEKYDKEIKNYKINCYYNHSFWGANPAGNRDFDVSDRFTKNKTGFWIWDLPREGARYIVSCLPAGEKVLTENGLKNIEEVRLEDKLFDRNGNLTSIRNIQTTHGYDGEVFEYSIANIYRTTKFTNEHPILSSKETLLKRNYNKNHNELEFNERYWDFDFKFNKAEELKDGDWLIYPNLYKDEKTTLRDLDKIWDNYNKTRIDFQIKNLLKDPEFWWYIGIWLAEGWVYTNSKGYKTIHTAHNNLTELKYLERINNLFERYNRNVSYTNKGNNCFEAKLSSSQIHDFLLENFGKYASGKNIPEWAKYIPKNLKLKLLEGYLNGDGCTFVDGRRSNGKTSFVSISLELLEGIQDMLFSVGLISNLQLLRNESEAIIRGKKHKTKKTYQLNLEHYDTIKFLDLIDYKHDLISSNKRTISGCHFSKDFKNIFFKIQKVEKSSYKGSVYNFETDDHTFLCKNITTHNCDVARGDGKDYSTIQVLDAATLEQVAEYQGKLGPDSFAHLIYRVAMDYNEAYVVVEANSFGLATCLELKNKLKYKKLYHSKSIQKMVEHYSRIKIDEGEDVPGFQTTARTRPLLVSCLMKYMRSNELKLKSQRIIEEFKTFVIVNDKAQHEPGFNDDLIIALGIGLFIRDTEFENVMLGQKLFSTMLDAIDFSSSSYSGQAAKAKDGEKGSSPIYGSAADEIADDDLGWLLG